MAVENHAAPPSRAACPDPERLANYVERVALTTDERRAIEAHLVSCQACRQAIAEAAAYVTSARDHEEPVFAPERSTPRARRVSAVGIVAGLAAAALVAIAIRVGVRSPQSDDADVSVLIEAVRREPTRPILARLTNFAYRPPPLVTRGLTRQSASPDTQVEAAELERAVVARDTPSRSAAFGVACLAVGRFNDAVVALESAVRREPEHSRFSADLSAAYIARAEALNRQDDWPAALAAADRAIARDPRSAEALFNRALALEGLHDDARAATAWDAFLRLNTSDEWANEASERLSRVRARLGR